MRKDEEPRRFNSAVVVALISVCLVMVGLNIVGKRDRLMAPVSGPCNMPKDGFVRGDLGGVAVKIPVHFAELIEFDGDPGFGEWRAKDCRMRSANSRISSFGFSFRFPDMRGLDSEEMRREKKAEILSDVHWYSAGFNSGEDYPGDGFMARSEKWVLQDRSDINPLQKFERLSTDVFGLEAYIVPGVNPATSKPWRENPHAEDLFLGRDAAGKLAVEIRCSNRNVMYQPCMHYFSLEPKYKAGVYLMYPRYALKDWREIQAGVVRIVESFRNERDAGSR